MRGAGKINHQTVVAIHSHPFLQYRTTNKYAQAIRTDQQVKSSRRVKHGRKKRSSSYFKRCDLNRKNSLTPMQIKPDALWKGILPILVAHTARSILKVNKQIFLLSANVISDSLRASSSNSFGGNKFEDVDGGVNIRWPLRICFSEITASDAFWTFIKITKTV